jgi:Phage-related protein
MAKTLRTIELLEKYGFSIPTKYSKQIRGKIWELRIQFSNDIQRIFYFAPKDKENQFILLHGFTKHMQRTPESEINIAQKIL